MIHKIYCVVLRKGRNKEFWKYTWIVWSVATEELSWYNVQDCWYLMDQVVCRYGERNVLRKNYFWQLQDYSYRYLNYNKSDTSFNICYFFAFCVYSGLRIGCTYILLTLHLLMVCLYVLFIVWFCKLFWKWPTVGWNTSSILRVWLWKWQL